MGNTDDRLKFVSALSALSWMPHWACHYYRLETASRFVAGTWEFSRGDSVAALCIYGLLIAGGLLCILFRALRGYYLLLSGLLQLCIATFQIYRLAAGLPFIVFSYEWSAAATIRECILVSLAGFLFITSAIIIFRLDNKQKVPL